MGHRSQFRHPAVCLLLALGCSGQIEPDAADVPVDMAPPVAPPDEGGPAPPAPRSACAPGELVIAHAPLRRLTAREYDNTVRALLGGPETESPSAGFSEDDTAGGFLANSVQAVNRTQLDDYLEAAESIARRAVAAGGRLSQILPCDWATTACVRPFIESFGRAAFRRPLDPDQAARYVSLYEAARGQDARVAMETVLTAILSSPDFLYLPESAAPGTRADGPPLLDGHAMASRLSFFLWQGPPDARLLDLAGRGMLADPHAVAAEAERLLRARARVGISAFAEQWLELDDFDEQPRDRRAYLS
jgi:hypothetical protein